MKCDCCGGDTGSNDPEVNRCGTCVHSCHMPKNSYARVEEEEHTSTYTRKTLEWD